MNSGNVFLAFLKKKENLKYIILALVAAVLIVLGTCGKSEEAVSYESDEEFVEARLSELCSSVKGVGKCRVMVSLEYEEQKYSSKERVYRVSAVSVVCDGGEREAVRAALTELISALYGIGANRISVQELG